ncbi:hypothetical protein AQUCO_00900804v1 [Aquilegia coerulea]|uniref:Laccase n=1 Tax=Aquilegia coerulea TaxID=218851 RepID=A0A2G5EFI2_AQUCA|nr:hypothetical protein AQUCO_00900804v1 [Aquilegia coerulea]
MGMARTSLLLLLYALALLASATSAEIVEHTLIVGNLTIERLCKVHVITAVNGSLPGPTIDVREGDTLVIHVFNESPYNITLHWHGVHQRLSAWADGPAYVTQCPIVPANSYTYRFTITGQEGTLWWHAHISTLRATVYGALIIRPRSGLYPFPEPYANVKPFMEIPIVLGEWWNQNIVDMESDFLTSGGGPSISDAYTINGQPGHLYSCSKDGMHKFNVEKDKTYLLRIINAAMNNQLFFKIARHNFVVVAIDASYTNPYFTDVLVIAPGQSMDLLFMTDQPVDSYYMAARPYSPVPAFRFQDGTTTALISYVGANSLLTGLMPILPYAKDTSTAFKLSNGLTSHTKAPHWLPCPQTVDEKMFITLSIGFVSCGPVANCKSFLGRRYRSAASMNNQSFVLPTKLSMLEAFHYRVEGIYTKDFPDNPPMEFDYTSSINKLNLRLIMPNKGTRVKKLKYGSTVEIVMQDTALVLKENHPMHFHGFDFYVLAQGFGNYDPVNDPKKFNLVNPQKRNTIAVPIGGWAVIRFLADNPGVWFAHCHLETHSPWGLDMAFEIENGPTPSTTLPPPPADLPSC